MAQDRTNSEEYFLPIRRLLIGILVFCLILLTIVWRIDSPRVERFRMAVIDRVVPNMEWAMAPVTATMNIIRDAQSYSRIYEQNQELRRELQQMKAWKEAALQLELKNARLLDLNNVRLDADLTYVTGVVLTDSGSSFRKSVLLNIGERDGLRDGMAAMDGIGLVGRIAGLGQETSRVLLLTDANSRLPITIQPSGQTAILFGDNSPTPLIDFLEKPELVRPGDRVVTSGDGGVFPADLLVGQLIESRDGRYHVRLAADFERLAFLRVLRGVPKEEINDQGEIIIFDETVGPDG
ncbi:MAG: rod shape-determining protein MreC [Paracoccaceae bacterium]|nr:rod shape-determining protein MreC [Paracoccaceae bacterium]MDG1738512.1 rod shape-determining protein MreC [Paracoccaceae bacterium]MDG2260234.1 rod shape-determining protein MreC [Paracoccaceae bacterium]